MAVEVMAWNVLDSFSDERRAREVIEVVREERPTIAVFSEAYTEGKTEQLGNAVEDLNQLGYAVIHGPYYDNDGRRDRHGIMGIVHKDALGDEPPHLIRYENRNGVFLPIIDPEHEVPLGIRGKHANDRHEEGRLIHTAAALNHIRIRHELRAQLRMPYEPAVVMGDLNALHGDTPTARLVRAAGPIAERMPSVDPARMGEKQPTVKRIGSLASRATRMAAGDSMRMYTEADFRDADPHKQGTKGPLQLDHVLVEGRLIVTGFRRHAKLSTSDHRGITARISTVNFASPYRGRKPV